MNKPIQHKRRELTIMRGLPGSGKTTIAKALIETGQADVMFEADDFFTAPSGAYRRVDELLGQAHTECRKAARTALAEGKRVIISNTSVRWSDMLVLLKLGYSFLAHINIYDCQGRFPNIHGVDDEKMKELEAKYLSARDFSANHYRYFGLEYQHSYTTIHTNEADKAAYDASDKGFP